MRAFRVAYDGRKYAGFQRQPQTQTVEGTLLRALAALGQLEPGDGPTHATPTGYAAAGRTDAGVSAVRQTIAFETPDWLSPRAFNAELPGSIRVWAHADVDEAFHATHHAVRRTYRYYLYAPATTAEVGLPPGTGGPTVNAAKTTIDPSLDEKTVRDALKRLSGRYDFRNLTPEETGTIRSVTTSATRDDDFLAITIAADGFPRAFVRRLITLVTDIGRGRREPSFVDRVLDPTPLPGPMGIGPAPPEPLVLWDVTYEDVDFERDEEAAESAQIAFTERYQTARQAAVVADGIRGQIGSSLDV